MRTTTTLAGLLSLATVAAGAWAQTPTGAQVVSGQASIQQAGNVQTIANTPGAIIQWQGFSIGAGEITRFVQQNAASTVLNRVVGQDPSRILGTLQSNGRVVLVNPNGVLFGAGARVDVNGLVATSLALSNQDFLAGRMHFAAGAVAGRVANEGTITTPSGGKVYLLAPEVSNSGVIRAPGGEVLLAAGRRVQLVDSSSPDLHVVVSAPGDQALNLGQVLADGGRAGIYGALVRQQGRVSADSATVGANGRVVLRASGDLRLEAGSTTSARGGAVDLLGDRVGLFGDAVVDASGATGGGTVRIGSDGREGDAQRPLARQVAIDGGASVRADAVDSGNGGSISVASHGLTRMQGSLSARGGAASGDGGAIEVSGLQLSLPGSADTRAPNGRTGSLLLDPTNIYIANDQTSATAAGMVGTDLTEAGFAAETPVADSLVTTGALQLMLNQSMVTVSTANAAGTGAGFIRVVDPISWLADTSLTLRADAGIALDATISGRNGSVLGLHALTGDITQTAFFSVQKVVARADTGSVYLGMENFTGELAGYAGGAGGFNFRNNGLTQVKSLTAGALTESGVTVAGAGPINLRTGSDMLVFDPIRAGTGNITLSAGGTYESSAAVTSNGGSITIQGVVVQAAAVPSSASICAIAPSSAACQVLAPPPVQASTAPPLSVLNTAVSSVVALNNQVVLSTQPVVAGGAAPDTKVDTKVLASSSPASPKTGGEPAKKMYCN